VDVPKGGDFRTAEPPAWLEQRGGVSALALHVQPGARRTAIVGVHGARLKIAIATPPVEGRANAALLKFLADRLGVARSSLELVSGANARDKRVAITAQLASSTIVDALSPRPGQK
jgi:uncharacterized protein